MSLSFVFCSSPPAPPSTCWRRRNSLTTSLLRPVQETNYLSETIQYLLLCSGSRHHRDETDALFRINPMDNLYCTSDGLIKIVYATYGLLTKQVGGEPHPTMPLFLVHVLPLVKSLQTRHNTFSFPNAVSKEEPRYSSSG